MAHNHQVTGSIPVPASVVLRRTARFIGGVLAALSVLSGCASANDLSLVRIAEIQSDIAALRAETMSMSAEVKGIEYRSDLSWKSVTMIGGLLGTLVFDKLLSHRRELVRLRRMRRGERNGLGSEN